MPVKDGMVVLTATMPIFMQLSRFVELDQDKILIELFQAYFDARRSKRNTINALAFEKHFESNLLKGKSPIGTVFRKRRACFTQSRIADYRSATSPRSSSAMST